MHLCCKVCNGFLLLHVEGALVRAVCHHSLAKLTAGHVVQHHALFAKVHHFAVVERLEFLQQLGFFCKFLELRDDFCVNLLCCVVIAETAAHGNGILCDALSAAFTLERICHGNLILEGSELLETFKFRQIVP